MRVLVRGVVLYGPAITRVLLVQVLNDDKQLHPRSKLLAGHANWDSLHNLSMLSTITPVLSFLLSPQGDKTN